MTTILVWEQALARASEVWADQADRLRGAHRSIGDADPDALGPRVAVEAAAFLAHWRDRVQQLQSTATDHAEALGAVYGRVALPDVETARRLEGLLPYGAVRLPGVPR